MQAFRAFHMHFDSQVTAYRFENEKSPEIRDLLVAVLHTCCILWTAHTFPELLITLTKKGQSL